jgi:hypothetical protein
MSQDGQDTVRQRSGGPGGHDLDAALRRARSPYLQMPLVPVFSRDAETAQENAQPDRGLKEASRIVDSHQSAAKQGLSFRLPAPGAH